MSWFSKKPAAPVGWTDSAKAQAKEIMSLPPVEQGSFETKTPGAIARLRLQYTAAFMACFGISEDRASAACTAMYLFVSAPLPSFGAKKKAEDFGELLSMLLGVPYDMPNTYAKKLVFRGKAIPVLLVSDIADPPVFAFRNRIENAGPPADRVAQISALMSGPADESEEYDD